MKKAAVKLSWILKSGRSVFCVPVLFSSLACSSFPVSTPRRSELPRDMSYELSTNLLSMTPITSFLLYLRRRVLL